MIFLVVAALLLAAVAVRLVLPALRRRRMAAELSGDWWPRFESEFRAYSSRFAQSARDGEWRG
jgi:cytochrome c-type biogenesis protein CcmH/NrfG